MKTLLATLALLVAVAADAGAGQSAEVDIAFREGRVSIAASNVSAASVLAVWSKVGQTAMNGTELLEKRIITLKQADLVEAEALQLIVGHEFDVRSSLKRAVEPGTSVYADLSVSAAEPWTDPEVKYSYFEPEKAVRTDSLEPSWPVLEKVPDAPETIYEYYMSDRTVPDGLKAEYTTLDLREWRDPEIRFKYYFKLFDLEPMTPVYPATTNPNPWVDPEKRFKYFVPAKAGS